ncbi:hypothetical protein LOZ12_006046 [Ophidiomyces ophidiicola]|uniref:Uncharacterized protein n=1 Tax=Ophidiomyces ophidiicola TaxID=1387563 RepID=A0ACB8UVJ4_9EURO|nr:hypothetical protein LOZ62_002172 [Ophidiomyces ophidiicola]KAI1966416.1 hypothetical protein LOZ56_005756 [Ophidiomyces ophidiicola]KAI2004121.1 hypothetical protein LOZ50_004458 [Ophidiomyces ophidiicola]KAI2017538.1 hypothetical protein LOZ45_006255 [Ophidiomyces ophidiicola]KAI2032054.1 hypothetical protein LOZ47_005906 [Ophidiomyces ophidiicola]
MSPQSSTPETSRLMKPNPVSIPAPGPTPAEDGATNRSSAFMADLIPILIAAMYVLFLLCWFHRKIANLSRKIVSFLKFSEWRKQSGGEGRGGYINVAEEADEEEDPAQDRGIEPTPAKASLTGSKKRRKRPKSLVLKDYARLPLSLAEGFTENEQSNSESTQHQQPSGYSNNGGWRRQKGDPLGLSKHFDAETGRLKRHVLLDPGTKLNQMRFEDADRTQAYNGGLGNNVIARWFDHVVHWTVVRSQAWLEPNDRRNLIKK